MKQLQRGDPQQVLLREIDPLLRQFLEELEFLCSTLIDQFFGVLAMEDQENVFCDKEGIHHSHKSRNYDEQQVCLHRCHRKKLCLMDKVVSQAGVDVK
jgi:hypothetical protein